MVLELPNATLSVLSHLRNDRYHAHGSSLGLDIIRILSQFNSETLIAQPGVIVWSDKESGAATNSQKLKDLFYA